MWWFVAAFFCMALNIFYWKTNGNFLWAKVVDGEITEVDIENKRLKVRYMINGRIVEAYSSDDYRDYSKLKLGTKVLVSINEKTGLTIVSYNKKGKDTTYKGAQKAGIIMTVACLIMGIVSLFKN